MLQVQCECRVVQFDGLRNKGVFQSVGFAPGEKEPGSERASLCDDDSVQRVTGSVHNRKEFFFLRISSLHGDLQVNGSRFN